MKITIDETTCKKKKLSVPEMLLLMAVRLSPRYSETLQSLMDKQAVTGSPGELAVTQHWSSVADEILSDSTGLVDDMHWLSQLAKEFAQTFPIGKMQGTPYYYRCNNKELALRFKRFFASHPEYKPSENMRQRIINAAERYNREMDFDPRYRTLSKYFISKVKQVPDDEGIIHNEEVSQLASYLENENQDTADNGDWLVKSRN